MVISVLFTTTKTKKQCNIYNGISFIHKKKEIPLFVTTWMDIQGMMLTDISQTDKQKYYLILYVGSKIKNSWVQGEKALIDCRLPRVGECVKWGKVVKKEKFKEKKHSVLHGH